MRSFRLDLMSWASLPKIPMSSSSPVTHELVENRHLLGEREVHVSEHRFQFPRIRGGKLEGSAEHDAIPLEPIGGMQELHGVELEQATKECSAPLGIGGRVSDLDAHDQHGRRELQRDQRPPRTDGNDVGAVLEALEAPFEACQKALQVAFRLDHPRDRTTSPFPVNSPARIRVAERSWPPGRAKPPDSAHPARDNGAPSTLPRSATAPASA